MALLSHLTKQKSSLEWIKMLPSNLAASQNIQEIVLTQKDKLIISASNIKLSDM